MPAKSDLVPGPPKPPSPGRLLHEIRVSSDPEIRHGRNLVLLIALYLVCFAAARVAICHLMLGVQWIPAQIARLVVVGVLSICLFRGLLLARVITAIYTAAAFLAAFAMLYYGATHKNILAIFFSIGGMLGYLAVVIVLLLSSSIRAFLGNQRAQRRIRREEKEKQSLRKVLEYQATKIETERQ